MWTAGTFTSDQFSQIQVTSTQPGGGWIGAGVRLQGGGQDGYVGLYYGNGGSPDLMLFKRSGGGWAQLEHVQFRVAGGRDAAGGHGRRVHDLAAGERQHGHLGLGQQLYRGRAGHHGLRQRPGRQLVRRGRRGYTIGGTVSGLSGTVVLQDNGGDTLSVSGNGSFTFATAVVRAAATT